MRYFHFSMRAKLSIGLSFILLIAFAAINLLNYGVSRSSMRRSIIDDALPGISNEIYQEIQNDLLVPAQVSSLMANDTFLKDWVLEGEEDVSKITKYLWQIKQKYDFFSAFLISDRTRKYYHFSGVLKEISREDDHDVWYYRFVESRKSYDLDVDTDEASQGTLTIFINHRLNGYEGELLGVTGVGLKMSTVGRTLHSYQDRYEKEIYLVNKDGLVQVHPDAELIENRNITEQPGIGGVARELLSNKSAPSIREYDSNGQHIILIARYIPEFDWFLIVEHEETSGMRNIRFNFMRNLAIGLVVTVLVIVINVLMVNHFQSKLEDVAATDELTGLPNRRGFQRDARRDVAQAVRYGYPISVCMIDLDHFKDINDTYGHDAGDQVLRRTADLMEHSLRQGDLTGRVGGEEFAVSMPQTGPEEALEVAERLRSLIERSQVQTKKGMVDVTVSIGVASGAERETDLENLLARADESLYRAKESGRNQVCVAKESET